MSVRRHVVVINIFFAPYSYGGATIVAEQVGLALQAEHDTKITVISAMSRSDLAPYAVMKSAKSGIVNYLINLPKGRGFEAHYDNPQVTAQVARLLRQIQPDLVHLHAVQELGIGIVAAAKQAGLPVVISVHDFWWLCERQFMIKPDRTYCGQDPIQVAACEGCVEDIERTRLRDARLKATLQQADLVTFPSRFARDLSVRSGLDPKTAVLWENGIVPPSLGFFDAQLARRRADSRLTFGFVGGPSDIKGWPILYKAFQSLPRDDFRGFLVEGSMDGTWWPGHDIRAMKGDWQIHPRYAQAEADMFYAKVDVLLFLSQWKETFGLTIREALARGLRIIQTDSGGTTEYPGADPATMLKIGDGADILQSRIMAVLDSPDDHPAPIAVRDFSRQAAAFKRIITQLVKD